MTDSYVSLFLSSSFAKGNLLSVLGLLFVFLGRMLPIIAMSPFFGSRFEVERYFPSGLRIYIWYTLTNGNDKINGHSYHDKGVGISMPLDFFYTKTDRSRWGYGMSAWLRDVGATSFTGKKLYNLIREQRNDY